jgi:hypothetical protein
LGIPVLEHIEVTPEQIRYMANIPITEGCECSDCKHGRVMLACADVVEAVLNDVDDARPSTVIDALARLESL